METEQLDLQEYETRPAVRLFPEQRDALLGYPLTIGPTSGTADRYDVTAGSFIGSIELPGLSVRIRPKLAVDRVLFLISYSTKADLSPGLTGYEEQPDLFEAMVAGFAAQVRRALRPGLLQGYRTEEESLPTLRGRIRFEAMVGRRLGVTPPVDVRYDDFTVDINENRVIKAALDRLSRMRLRSEQSRRELRSFAAALMSVSSVEYGHQLPTFVFSRLSERYRPAIDLALLILRSISFDLSRGGIGSSAFLIDMNRVFEDFVVEALRDTLRLSAREFPQGCTGHRLTLDVAGRVPLKPDISWWTGHRCDFVGDVKYKKTEDSRAPNADLYQLLAYCIAADLPGGMLIFASGEEEPGEHRVRHAGKSLEMIALDLAGPPNQVMVGIHRIADRIVELRTHSGVRAARDMHP